MSLKDEFMEIKKEVEEVRQNSFAMELLQDARKSNKRMFIIILVILAMWFATIGYLVYILNDIGTIEENTSTQEISDINSIDNRNIVNGDYNG